MKIDVDFLTLSKLIKKNYYPNFECVVVVSDAKRNNVNSDVSVFYGVDDDSRILILGAQEIKDFLHRCRTTLYIGYV